VDDSAKSKPSSSDLLAGPAAAHLTNAAEVSGSSARCSASTSASCEGTHSPSTATRIAVEASIDVTSNFLPRAETHGGGESMKHAIALLS